MLARHHVSSSLRRSAPHAWTLSPRAVRVLALCLCLAAVPAHAADSTDLSVLYEGETIGLIYVPILSGIALEELASPPSQPLLFSADEGGATHLGNTVPSAAVGVLAGAGLLSIATSGGPASSYHFKGLLESLSVTFLLTQTAKVTLGRHRPDYLPTSTEPDDRRSFMSGHASHTLATTAYLALYLDAHVWPRWRAPGSRFSWWEALPHATLVALSIYIPTSRVLDNRHHPSDVLAGSALGLSTSLLFYAYQERRLRRDQAGASSDSATTGLQLLPFSGTALPGFSLSGRF